MKEGWTFLHNLLSITGEFHPQPFTEGEVVALFNGEIYNYRDFGSYATDGEALLPLYREHGTSFVEKLDGEFALVLFDFAKGLIVFSTDVFATKPLWMGQQNSRLGFATYRSSLQAEGFTEPKRVPANTTIVLDIKGEEVERRPVFTFEAGRQYKDTVDDWIGAFEASIRKRSRDLREKIFIGLSSGYDSGAIACELSRERIPYKAFSILGKENRDVLEQRHARAPESELIELPYTEYSRAKYHLKLYAEEFTFPINPDYRTNLLSDDPGAIGLSAICARARAEGFKIYFSGQGADEILSDYGRNGTRLSSHSTFGGVFPEDLERHFPWTNFYEGAQVSYLSKEEYVAGSYGIEGRYPFLDKYLVQEFLWLSTALKNKGYKYPLYEYLRRQAYPLAEEEKIGFVLGTYPLMAKLVPSALYERAAYYGKRVFS